MEYVENFLASHGYSDATKDAYRRIYARILTPFEEGEETGQALEHLTAAGLVQLIQSQDWGNSQQCVAVAACRKYLRWRFGQGHPALSAKIKVIPTPPQPRLSKEQVIALLASFDISTEQGIRDRALTCIALDSNLRASELCHLQVGNIYLKEGRLFALVKGGQWAWKTFSPRTSEYIRAWIDVRTPAVGVQALFISFQAQNFGKPLTREGLQTIMKIWGRKVGFHISPHMFRRSYASQSTLAGAPKNIVKTGGGWKSDKMVDHYIGELALESTRAYLPVDQLFAAED